MNKGRFIVFEGLDGSGKSTALEGLRQALQEKDPDKGQYLTREPSDGEVGRLIRRALTKEIVLHQKTFTLLFAADRYEHIQNEIKPALARGEDVFCDRYYFSNLAYQGDVATAAEILAFNQPARTLIRPDIVFFVDTPAEECMNRIHRGRDQEELFERLDKLKSVERLYKEAFDLLREEENIHRIDGLQTPETIVGQMLDILEKEC